MKSMKDTREKSTARILKRTFSKAETQYGFIYRRIFLRFFMQAKIEFYFFHSNFG
jgi:hypothetical protein